MRAERLLSPPTSFGLRYLYKTPKLKNESRTISNLLVLLSATLRLLPTSVVCVT